MKYVLLSYFVFLLSISLSILNSQGIELTTNLGCNESNENHTMNFSTFLFSIDIFNRFPECTVLEWAEYE